MIETPDLIRLLAASGSPVRPLRAPHVRAFGWLAFAAALLVMLAIHHGLRSDLDTQLGRAGFVVSIVASALTGVLAATAAFTVSVPGNSRQWMWLPVPALVVWLWTVSYGCLTHWVSIDPEGIALGTTARCFATMTLASVPLSLVLLVMLRHAAMFRPVLAMTLGSLAVAAISASALSLLHDLDATVLILIWNVGAATAIVAAGAIFGRSYLARLSPSLTSR
jgi:hypothetical protein